MRVAELLTNIFNFGTSSEDRGLIEINGVLNGAICKGSEVLITPSGRFYGKIEARNVEIAGVVQGDVEAESLIIHSSGQLYYGKLKCQHLSVKDGGMMVNKGKKEGEKINVAQEKYPAKPISSDYAPGNTLENPVESECDNEVSRDAVGQPSQDNAHPTNDPRPPYHEAKLPQDEAHALQANTQKPLCYRKQPHFYSSY